MLPRPRWEPRDEGVMRILKLMAPAALGVSVAQVSLVINTQIASFLGDGAVSWLYFADRLMEFPSALLGVALGTVLLPSLVRHHADERSRGPTRTCSTGACAWRSLLALPGRARRWRCWRCRWWPRSSGTASSRATTCFMTRSALIAYAVGLGGLILVKILAPGFYARQNIRTPVKVAIVTLVVTQLLNVAVRPLASSHAGLALSISLAACFNAGWLWFLMRRSGAYTPGARLGRLPAQARRGPLPHGRRASGTRWARESSWFELAAAPARRASSRS